MLSVGRSAPDGEGPGLCPLRSRLLPAALKKYAGGFVLSIALGLLLGGGQASFDRPGTFSIVGELALIGETRPIKVVLRLIGWNVTSNAECKASTGDRTCQEFTMMRVRWVALGRLGYR
jgi:predicted ATPase with chaperone activity